MACGQYTRRPPSDDGDDDENDTIEEEDEEEAGEDFSSAPVGQHQHQQHYQHQYTSASPGRSISQNRTRALRYRKPSETITTFP